MAGAIISLRVAFALVLLSQAALCLARKDRLTKVGVLALLVGMYRPLLRKVTDLFRWGRQDRSRPKAKDPESLWDKTAKISLWCIAIVVIWVTGSEAMHYGYFVVEPFAYGDADKSTERLGDQFAKLLVDQLSKMRKDIPELIVVSNPADGTSGGGGGSALTRPGPPRTPANLLAESESSGIASAVGGNNEINLFGLKIPLGSLATVVQAPLRQLFQVEQIAGSIYKETVGKTVYWRIAGDQPDSGMTRSFDAFERFDRGLFHMGEFDNTGRRAELRRAIACFQQAILIDRGFFDAYYRLALAFEKGNQPLRASEVLRSVPDDKPNSFKGLLHRADVMYDTRNFYPTPPPVVPPVVLPPPAADEAVQVWLRVAEEDAKATAQDRRLAFLNLCIAEGDEETRELGKANEKENQDTGAVWKKTEVRAEQLKLFSEGVLRRVSRDMYFLPYYFCRRAEALDYLSSDSNDPDARRIRASLLNQLGVTVGMHNQRLLQMPEVLSSTTLSDRIVRLFRKSLSHSPSPAPNGRVVKGSVSKYFCDESAIDDSNLHPGSIPLIMWTSPIGRYATPYYAESHRLAPDDTQLACNYATFALYSNHDSVPMRALVKNGRFRTANGKTFSRIAHEYAYGTRGDALNSTSREDTQLPTRRNAELPAMYYAMALENFQATLDRNPSSAEAISDVGYCLWSWTVDAKVKRFQGPDPQKLAGATTMAEKALRFLPPRQDFNQLIDLDATLVELYIAGGRSQAAVKEIEKLKTELPNDDELFDLDNAIYVYLDSAHAHACASAVSLNDKAKHETATKADLAHIQSLGERNEFRPFGDMKDDFSLDTLREIRFDPLPLPK